MNLSQEPTGRGKYHYQTRTDQKSSQALDVQTSKPKNPQIQKCIQRLSAKKLFGHPHVKRYFYDQYRRGCRPATIRSSFESFILFKGYLKRFGRNYLEEITRDVLSSFIEHQQDRGLKPNTVSTSGDSFNQRLCLLSVSF